VELPVIDLYSVHFNKHAKVQHADFIKNSNETTVLNK